MKWIIVSLLLIGDTIEARELDSFSHRHQYGHTLIDSADALDSYFELKMRSAIQRLGPKTGVVSRAEWFDALKRTFLSPIAPWLISPLEVQIERTDWISKFTFEDRGIFGPQIGFDEMGFAWYIALASILRVRGHFIGVDKIGHFVSQGLEYWRASLEGGDTAALALGHSQEWGQMGRVSGGVYSFSDLAANVAGYRYFEDVRSRIEQNRSATLPKMSSYVTREWDEVLLPSWIPNPTFFKRLSENALHSICPHARSNPSFFNPPHPKERSLGTETYLSAESRALLSEPQRLDIHKICGMPQPH